MFKVVFGCLLRSLQRDTWNLIPLPANGKHAVKIWDLNHGSLALDGRLVWKISKRHFFQDINNSFHGVTQIGPKPHQKVLQIFFSTNMVARGVESFCIIEDATDPLIEQWLKFFF